MKKDINGYTMSLTYLFDFYMNCTNYNSLVKNVAWKEQAIRICPGLGNKRKSNQGISWIIVYSIRKSFEVNFKSD